MASKHAQDWKVAMISELCGLHDHEVYDLGKLDLPIVYKRGIFQQRAQGCELWSRPRETDANKRICIFAVGRTDFMSFNA